MEDYSLLVVEDDRNDRELLCQLLLSKGYKNLDEAEDGRVALDKISQTNYDAILLNIEMPEIDGFGVLEFLQRDKELQEIPVLVISRHEDIESILKCIKLGATDYLHKPVNSVLLHTRLKQCVEKKRLRDQQAEYIRELQDEKKRSDKLFNLILPPSAAKELKTNGEVPPRFFEQTSVLFCDIVNFTAYCSSHPASEAVSGLQNVFEKFEQLTFKHRLEKTKTIGDEFMATSGLLHENEKPLHSAVSCGLEMIDAANSTYPHWKVRVGINHGPVIAGIIGHDKFQFDLWGDTVNTAARMVGVAEENMIALPAQCWITVKDKFKAKTLGMRQVKGKGELEIMGIYDML